MTATIKPPEADNERQPIRMSWMESLGFSHSTDVWSDRPLPDVPPSPYAPGKTSHDTVADWQPQDIGSRLTKGRIRWGLLLTTLALAGLVTYGVLWFLDRPAAEAEAASTAVAAEATSLAAVLPQMEDAINSLVDSDVDTTALVATDTAARSLFDASAALTDDAETRSASTNAASMALDAVRLIGDANAYKLAVTPILIAPELETDPELIALDDAARSFGEWQLQFDSVRTALPDGVMSGVTTQLDVLSADMATMLEGYVDALRLDDMQAAQSALDGLIARLDEIAVSLSSELAAVQVRATDRLTDARNSLDLLVG